MELNNLVDQLLATPAVLRKMLASADEDLANWKPSPDEWCIKEIVGHLIDSDKQAFHDRIQLMVAEDHPELPVVDADAVAPERRHRATSLQELLDTFSAQRPFYTEFVRELSHGQMQRTATYKKFGTFYVADFVYEWLFHDHEHLRQISAIIRASLWPKFSDTMKRALRG